MRTWIRRHRWLAVGLAVLLAGGQVAAAAYACADAGSEPVTTVHGPDCTGHAKPAKDPAQPLLCKAHCESGQQTVNTAAVSASVPAPALIDELWMRVIDPEVVEQVAAAMPEAQPVGPPAGTPPLYLAHLALRY
ncbi:MAG: hypothetical protein OEW27_15000 [Aquincola sp.]|nr:hypothetical protein [Aquincola sp.]